MLDSPSIATPRGQPLRRRAVRRVLLAVITAGWIIGGFIGTYSYIDNYYLHRGFAAPVRLANASSGRLLNVHFYSPALHRSDSYLIYLPGGYRRTRHYPVFYLLHGLPGRSVSFTVIGHIEVRMENLISQHRMGPMILVFPDGRINGDTYSDSEWANTTAGNFDSSVEDVVHNVDQRFATVPKRQDRVMAGLSAGAYGAINVALHHVPTFGSIEVWSGYFAEPRAGVFARATAAQLAYNSPIEYVRRLGPTFHRYPFRAFLFVGRTDPASLQIRPMTSALRAEDAYATDAVYPGGHDWQLWNRHLEQMLILAWRDVTHRLRRPVRLSGRRHHRTHISARHRRRHHRR